MLPSFQGEFDDSESTEQFKPKNKKIEYKQEVVDAVIPILRPKKNFLCGECKRKFASNHLLELHVEEAHSGFFLAALKRGRTDLYTCLDSDCPVKCDSWKIREQHWMEVHHLDGVEDPPFILHNRHKKKRQAKGKSHKYTKNKKVSEVIPVEKVVEMEDV